jgi:hypothetical protein
MSSYILCERESEKFARGRRWFFTLEAGIAPHPKCWAQGFSEAEEAQCAYHEPCGWLASR